MLIRDATASDAGACAEIYGAYVRETVITFELDPPSAEAMAARIAASAAKHAWLVAEADGEILGYAYGGPYKERAAYRWSCEVSVYLAMGRRRTGLGRALYAALFARLVARGYRMATAGMTLPNPASEGLHRAMGFTPIGTWRRIGWKHDAWHDVMWIQRELAAGDDPPAEITEG